MTSALYFQLSCRSCFYDTIAAAASEDEFGGCVERGRFALAPGRFGRQVAVLADAATLDRRRLLLR
jgi:hypothetical protein